MAGQKKRDFLLADRWIKKIEQESSISCFEYARKTLHLFGGMKFREFSPKSGQYLLGKCNGDVNHLEKWYFSTKNYNFETRVTSCRD